jgi:hypothetical protein
MHAAPPPPACYPLRMGHKLGYAGLAGVVALCACDAPPDIHIRTFRTPRAEADYRVVTVLRGRRVHPVVETHFDPPFSTRPNTLSFQPFDVEMRLSPAGPLPAYSAVCFDVQRRGAWPDPVATARICTRFVKDQHLRQDVYFNWWPPCPPSSEAGALACPLPAPNCRLLSTPERERLEQLTPPPAVDRGDEVHDTSWGDSPSSASLVGSGSTDSLAMATICAYECPSLTETEPRPMPVADARHADAALDAQTDVQVSEEDASETDARDASDEDAVDERPHTNYCVADAGGDAGEDGEAGCVAVPP